MSVSPALRGMHKLVMLGPEDHIRVAGCPRALGAAGASAIARLGANAAKFLVRLGPEGGRARRWRWAAGDRWAFFGVASSSSAPRREALRREVIPVVEDTARFGVFVPPAILHPRGLSRRDCGADLRLAARVLEGVGLLRERRRLFISHRKVETSGPATRLNEALDGAGRPSGHARPAPRTGEPVQDTLWHRMGKPCGDTDVVLLLASPGFLKSVWTGEELARANTANVRLPQDLWPERQ